MQNLLSFARGHEPERRSLSLNEVVESVVALMSYQLVSVQPYIAAMPSSAIRSSSSTGMASPKPLARGRSESAKLATLSSPTPTQQGLEILRITHLFESLPHIVVQLINDQLARSETRVLVRLAALYKALGGGWEVFEPGDSAP